MMLSDLLVMCQNTWNEPKNQLISTARYNHRDRTRASTVCCFCLFFSSFEHAKTCWLWTPTILKTHQKCDFFIFNYEQYCQNLTFIVKKTPNLIKKLFLCFLSKSRVGPINSKHNNFKWGNIFASICTLVLSLCFCQT